MKIELENYGKETIKIINSNDEIIISDTDKATVKFHGKDCLKVWVNGQIIYIHPKGSNYHKYKGGTKTTVVFMDKVISGE